MITIIDEEDEKIVKKEKEVVMPPIETEPIESDSDDGVQFDDASQPEVPSRTPPRHHHHHRRHHRHHQNHHRDGGEENEEIVVEADRENQKDTRSSPIHQSVGTPVQSIPPSLDEDSRMSLVSEPEKTSGSRFSFFVCPFFFFLSERLNISDFIIPLRNTVLVNSPLSCFIV